MAGAERDAVGLLGLVFGLVAGLGWTANLREALSEQWAQRGETVPLLTPYGADLLAVIGLVVALLLSFGLTTVGTGMSGTVIELLGLGRAWLTRLLVVLAGLLLTLLAHWVVLVWVVARLPREPVTLHSAVRAGALGAVGLVALQQLVSVYLARVTTSPAGVVFGPVLGRGGRRGPRCPRSGARRHLDHAARSPVATSAPMISTSSTIIRIDQMG